ncbi:MAG: PEGA domain-containing protein [Myxococcota bacterium]
MLLLWVSLSAAAAPAEAPSGDAKRLFDVGSQFYARGQYAPAIRAFEEAARLAPLPAISFSLAQAIRLQYFVDHDAAKLRRAIELYREYVAATPSGGRRADAVAMLAELEPIQFRTEGERTKPEPPKPSPQTPTELLVTCAIEGAMVSIDGGPETAPPLAVTVSAGAHQVRVTHPDYFVVEERAVAIEHRSVGVDVSLKPKPATLSLSGDEEVTLEIDGRFVAKTPLSTPLELEAGRYQLRFSRSGHVPAQQALELARGEAASLPVELSLSTTRKWSYGLLIASAAALAGGGVGIGLALGDDSRAADLYARQTSGSLSEAEANRYDDLRRARDLEVGVSVALGAAGGALLATGVALLFGD